MKKFFLIVAALCVVSLASNAFADKLCLKITVNKKTGKATTQSQIKPRCGAGYTAIADTNTFQGAPGILNLAACRQVTNTCGLTGPGYCAISCSQGEFLLQTDIGTTGSCYASPEVPQYNNLYSNGLAAGAGFYVYGDCSYTATTWGVCCPVY